MEHRVRRGMGGERMEQMNCEVWSVESVEGRAE